MVARRLSLNSNLMRSLLLLLAACIVLVDATRLSYQGVASCLMEVGDLNTDAELSELELRLLLDRWVTTPERIMDQLTVGALLHQCDTDNTRSVSWKELSQDPPRCLTLTQTAGIAKWVCSRARNGDFVFDEYAALTETMEAGLLSGKGLKSISDVYTTLVNSRTGVQRAALARTLHVERLSPQINELFNDVGTAVSTVFTIPIAVVIIIIALFATCLL